MTQEEKQLLLRELCTRLPYGVKVKVRSNDILTVAREMIPDKLFFPEDGLPRYIDWDGSPIRTKQVEDSDICYIRKDVILEWLNGKVNDYGHTTPFRIAIQSVIDKLNSM